MACTRDDNTDGAREGISVRATAGRRRPPRAQNILRSAFVQSFRAHQWSTTGLAGTRRPICPVWSLRYAGGIAQDGPARDRGELFYLKSRFRSECSARQHDLDWSRQFLRIMLYHRSAKNKVGTRPPSAAWHESREAGNFGPVL